ncbi:MAG: AI-2E family transporter [Lachnospiraceae bacterium]|nr:AI-2E family transporter [Lachnospiraceae bacterium]MDY3223555.1 AI-2E family transporter [Lachnospiraceae bacterium]
MREKRSNKEIMLLILFTALVCLGVIHFSALLMMLRSLLVMIKPFLTGACIAFVVNLPLKFLEEKALSRLPEKAEKLRRPLSIFLSFLFIFAVVILVILTVIPQMGRALTQLGQKIPVFLERTINQAEILVADYPEILSWLNNLERISLNWDSILGTAANFLKNGVGSLLNSTFTVAGSLVGGVVSGFIALIFSIYILSQKEKLGGQLKRILHAYCKEKQEQRILYVSGLLYRNFSKFITGQCTEAVILGLLFVIAMTIFRMPYAVMIGVLIAFTALIPIVGAFIGCFVGAFLILVDDPIKAVWFVIMFLIIQQLEGNLIYPKVVGNSVGLPSIWVLLAVSLGSSMFGVIGMLVFIPLFATIYTLLRDDVNRRNAGETGVPSKGREKA